MPSSSSSPQRAQVLAKGNLPNGVEGEAEEEVSNDNLLGRRGGHMLGQNVQEFVAFCCNGVVHAALEVGQLEHVAGGLWFKAERDGQGIDGSYLVVYR